MSHIFIGFGIGDGKFEPVRYFGTGSGPSDIDLADINRDGVLEVLIPHADSSFVSVLESWKVNESLPLINGVSLTSEGRPRVSIKGRADRQLRIEFSRDLKRWEERGRVSTGDDGRRSLIDHEAEGPLGFYRLVKP